MAAQSGEMEDILSSIRSSLAEQSAKVNVPQGLGEADAGEDVLELTEAEMVTAPEAAAADVGGKDGVVAGDDDLIDIHAFAKTGEAKVLVDAEAPVLAQEEVKPVEKPVESAQPASDKTADEFDRLLAEISTEQKQQVAVAEDQKKALLEDPSLGGIDEVIEKTSVTEEKPVAVEAAPVVQEAVQAPVKAVEYEVKALGDGEMPQVALPVEVLAMALRPMVEGWLKENLPAVVERLVREEIGKLNQG